ncbi:hypothetical protein RclHR1_04660006 [Rhizophagus clarus]|uniref:TLDc domain-containing protein n=1 Tax=Rhizophagus clarus TaxID=94130 RepID=A0A2Z6RNJ5_9GLOM|nr:hypothetical protein RclHR1_04660006 [Rhizophagus clarus]GES81644.1 hypothetical protein GLOIN_2v1474129 [Rhizophagus clarus]
MTSFFYPNLSKVFSLILDDSDDYDVLIQVGENENIKEFHIEQTPGLESENYNRNKWNNEDYEACKGILDEFIIRFTEITFNGFNDKIKPYQVIIPRQIYKEIEKFYYSNTFTNINFITSPSIGKLDSKIIEPKLVEIIINWIDKNDFFASCYKFDLIYRDSVDGINNRLFMSKCKGQGESLILIKVKYSYSNKIFGGYSSIGFHSSL